MKKIVLFLTATLVVALTVTTFFAFTAKKANVETQQLMDAPQQPVLSAETQALLAQTGGNVYFTVPANTANWANPGNWAVNPSNPACTGTGNICRVRLNTGQTLQQFLDANEGESYSDMLSHSQIDQKS